MALIIENIRRQEKRSTVVGQVPTIPATSDHTDGTWAVTDIYQGELFINIADGTMWTRDTNDRVIEIGTGWLKITSNFGDSVYNVASTLVDFEVFNLIEGYNLVKHFMKHTTKWSGGSISVMEASLGVSGNLSKFMAGAGYDVFQAIGDQVDNGVGLVNSVENWNSNTGVRLKMKATGGNLNTLTAGSLEIYLYIEKIR